MDKYRSILQDFDETNIPDLDIAVMGALELLTTSELPRIQVPFSHPLVIGSVNAKTAGKMIFANTGAVFADESSYNKVLNQNSDIDGVVLVSASGGKHAINIADFVKSKDLSAYLLTNNRKAPAAEYFEGEKVIVFPKNREPYTYNTSTYLSMILSASNESASDIKDFIETKVEPKLLRNFGSYSSFTLIVPPEFSEIRAMLSTKFDELFGPYINGRVFTSEEIKHAKTVVTSGDELFISFGSDNTEFGLPKNRLFVQLPENAGYGAVMSVGYYVVGRIQRDHPPYFKQNIASYTEKASKLFNQKIETIVE